MTQTSWAFGRPSLDKSKWDEHKTKMATAVVFIDCDDVGVETKHFRTFAFYDTNTVFWRILNVAALQGLWLYYPNLRFRMNMGGIQDPTRHVWSSAVGDHRFHVGCPTIPGFTRYD